jgi:hypothetical protein
MLRQRISRSLRRSPAWVAIRRLQYEGAWRAHRRWRIWSRILATPPIVTDPVGRTPIEVHLLCYQRDYLSALWALKTFYHFAGVGYPLVIHVQGDAPRRVGDRLQHHFPAARLILQTEADERVETWLRGRGLARLLAARQRTPFMMKLTDFAVCSDSIHILAIDSDVLFFQRPAELLAAVAAASPLTRCQRDPESTYNISEARAWSELGIALAPRVNTGILLFRRDGLSLQRCDDFLENAEVARATGFIEQTLFALCASERGGVAYWPDSYVVSLEPAVNLAAVVARHYAGPSRSFLTGEGMSELMRAGFLNRLNAT